MSGWPYRGVNEGYGGFLFRGVGGCKRCLHRRCGHMMLRFIYIQQNHVHYSLLVFSIYNDLLHSVPSSPRVAQSLRVVLQNVKRHDQTGD